jgi:hypothetical protein
MRDFILAEETLGYQTSTDPSNSDRRLLIAGSKNVLIDYQKKIVKRGGYTRLGVANTDVTENRNAWTWFNSTGGNLPQRFYDDELEVYLGTVDGYAIDAWTRVKDAWSTTEKLRATTWYDTTEKIDLQIMVQADANMYEWNGAIAVVDSVPSGTTVTKKGTTTFAQNRFYTTRNKTFVCVRTGTEYTYTGGESTTTLTGIADTTGIQTGDILVQKVVTQSNKPGASRTNHFIFSFENQIIIGSEDDALVYISKNTDYTTFSFSSPRVAGEGAILTLDAPTRGFGSIGKILIPFAGRSFIYRVIYEQITVGSTLAETIKVKRLDIGVDQGALNQECIVPIGNSLAYLSNEVALRIINNPEDLVGIHPKTLSNPIKPDFDAEDWTGAFGQWYKNILIYTAPVTSRMYMLNFIEDADGKLLRFWNPPQELPVGPMSIIDSGDGFLLHGHSNTVPETYLLFDGQSDGQYEDMDPDEKLPISATAVTPYNNYKKRAQLKTCDEYYVEGEITTNTTAFTVAINYDFDGATQNIERMIDGSDEDILEGTVGFNSLAQQSLAVNPLGGLLNPPVSARKFRVIFELSPEDFHEINATFSTQGIDEYWAIISHGANASMSRRRNTLIRK